MCRNGRRAGVATNYFNSPKNKKPGIFGDYCPKPNSQLKTPEPKSSTQSKS